MKFQYVSMIINPVFSTYRKSNGCNSCQQISSVL